MATYEKISAVLAIFLVIGIAGYSFYGNATQGAAAAGYYEFSIKSLDFPQNITKDNPFKANATFVNSGTLTASFVAYDYEIFDSRGAYAYRGRIADSYVNLPAGSEVKHELQPVYLTNGTYFVRLTLESENHFSEDNKSDNKIATNIRVY
ncbi:MAG: hypothetical protein HY438_00735 [DPANN group archaeon]|nr:hypothetical protein [DPANN group archaeon]